MDAKEAQVPAVAGVYRAILAVAADMARDGIGKTRQNVQQGYKFRGIDEVLNALAPSLVAHGLVILPRCIGRIVTERATKTGGTLFYVVVEAEFDFVAISDGSKHTVKTYGEAMDSADKATNKAMSAAYKYAAFQAFCIPIAGDTDADATTHEVAAKVAAQGKALADGLAGLAGGVGGGAAPSAEPDSKAAPDAAPVEHCAPVNPFWCREHRCDMDYNALFHDQALAEIKKGTRKLNKAGKPTAAPPLYKCPVRDCKSVVWHREDAAKLQAAWDAQHGGAAAKVEVAGTQSAGSSDAPVASPPDRAAPPSPAATRAAPDSASQGLEGAGAGEHIGDKPPTKLATPDQLEKMRLLTKAHKMKVADWNALTLRLFNLVCKPAQLGEIEADMVIAELAPPVSETLTPPMNGIRETAHKMRDEIQERILDGSLDKPRLDAAKAKCGIAGLETADDGAIIRLARELMILGKT